MTATVPEHGLEAGNDRHAEDRHDTAERLLRSSEELSFDPATQVDWDTPLDRDYHGMSPEWSSLYGTAYWAELTEEQRKELTRQESASVASTGIWFEMILQQLILRDFYAKDPTDPAFQWALTEIADECRHSIMFARGSAKLGAPAYIPKKRVVAMGRLCAAVYSGEAAYASILVAEEVLDVMQRDWMRDERVVPFVRTINNIHVVEESRHMKFAREETRDRLRGAGPLRRQVRPCSWPWPPTRSSPPCGTRTCTRTRASTGSARCARRGTTSTTRHCCGPPAPGSWSSCPPGACSPSRRWPSTVAPT